MFMLMFMFIMLLFKMSYLNILIITRFMVIMVATMIGMGATVATTDNINQIAVLLMDNYQCINIELDLDLNQIQDLNPSTLNYQCIQKIKMKRIILFT